MKQQHLQFEAILHYKVQYDSIQRSISQRLHVFLSVNQERIPKEFLKKVLKIELVPVLETHC